MADFLTDEWFAAANDALRAAPGAPPVQRPVRVVLELADAPSQLPHALTVTLDADGASLAPGDHLAADAIVRIAFADARALTQGDVDSATALRTGQIKVRGDLNAVIPVLDWLVAARRAPDA